LVLAKDASIAFCLPFQIFSTFSFKSVKIEKMNYSFKVIILVLIGLLRCTPSEDSLNSDSGGDPEVEDTSEWKGDQIINIAADISRNGVIDVRLTSDNKDEEIWTSKKGAILFANIDDDNKDKQLDGKNIAVDNDLDGADLGRVILEPVQNVSSEDYAKLFISPPNIEVHIFKRKGKNDQWRYFDHNKEKIKGSELKSGMEFGLEVTDYPSNPDQWDGKLLFKITLFSQDKEKGSDSIMFKVAPFLALHNLRPVEVLFANYVSYQGIGNNSAFIQTLESVAKRAGVKFVKINGNDPKYTTPKRPADQWTQDIFEVGYSALPHDVSTQRYMKVAVRTPDKRRKFAQYVHDALLGPDFGFVHKVSAPEHKLPSATFDNFGNFECTPPHKYNNKFYPLGRIIIGGKGKRRMDLALRQFLSAQQYQSPIIEIDTSWSQVGHVDEVITFLPAGKDSDEFRVIIASPRLAMDILRQLDGNLILFRGKRWSELEGRKRAELTVNQILNNSTTQAENNKVQGYLDNIKAQLKRELGITDKEFIELPVLYRGINIKEGGVDYRVFIPLSPSVINMLYINGQVVIPDPFGPNDGSGDRFKKEIIRRLSPLNLTIHFVDTWDFYHAFQGGVHCGTNVIRQPPNFKWWEIKED
jgi:protein-arginine deiminase